jgi:hypothetical protein
MRLVLETPQPAAGQRRHTLEQLVDGHEDRWLLVVLAALKTPSTSQRSSVSLKRKSPRRSTTKPYVSNAACFVLAALPGAEYLRAILSLVEAEAAEAFHDEAVYALEGSARRRARCRRRRPGSLQASSAGHGTRNTTRVNRSLILRR